MKNIDKRLTATKWVLINRPKYPKSHKMNCPKCLHKPKIRDFNEKKLHWASVVRDHAGETFIRSFFP